MSVYISGLEMPQDRRITLQIDSTGGVYVVNKFSTTSEKYEKSMIATDIQPHGRLIDADELVRIWRGAKIYGDIEPIVNARPTVIEAED
jgi:hypothetical protein